MLTIKCNLLLALLPIALVPLAVKEAQASVDYCYKIHPVSGNCESPALTGCSKGCKT